MFINISNHPSEGWTDCQKKAAEHYGELVDLNFPVIATDISDDKMNALVDEYAKKVFRYPGAEVMVQGEMVFTYRLVTKLKQNGYHPVAACTERRAKDILMEDGTVEKRSIFQFVGFREY